MIALLLLAMLQAPRDACGLLYADSWHPDAWLDGYGGNTWGCEDYAFTWSTSTLSLSHTSDFAQTAPFPAPALVVHVPKEVGPTLCIIDGDDWVFDYGCRITILRSGVVMLEDGMSPNAAAKLFWDAVGEVRKAAGR